MCTWGGQSRLFIDEVQLREGFEKTSSSIRARGGWDVYLTEFELEMREEPEKGLWLTAYWHQVRDDWRADAAADGIPAARRSRGWRFMLASGQSSGAPAMSCSTAMRRSPGCGDTCATRTRLARATAST